MNKKFETKFIVTRFMQKLMVKEKNRSHNEHLNIPYRIVKISNDDSSKNSKITFINNFFIILEFNIVNKISRKPKSMLQNLNICYMESISRSVPKTIKSTMIIV